MKKRTLSSGLALVVVAFAMFLIGIFLLMFEISATRGIFGFLPWGWAFAVYVFWFILAALCNIAGAALILIRGRSNSLLRLSSSILFLASLLAAILMYELWQFVKAFPYGNITPILLVSISIPAFITLGLVLLIQVMKQ